MVSSSDGRFKLTVDPDGAVSVQRDSHAGHGGEHGTLQVEVTGTRDADAFRLTWTGPGGSLDVVAPIDGATAIGTWEKTAGGTVYSGTITLECKNCKGEG